MELKNQKEAQVRPMGLKNQKEAQEDWWEVLLEAWKLKAGN